MGLSESLFWSAVIMGVLTIGVVVFMVWAIGAIVVAFKPFIGLKVLAAKYKIFTGAKAVYVLIRGKRIVGEILEDRRHQDQSIIKPTAGGKKLTAWTLLKIIIAAIFIFWIFIASAVHHISRSLFY